jgi:hypothetical protein
MVSSAMELIVRAKNKREEKVVKAFLSSLNIDYHSEVQEDRALYKAMSEGRKTPRLRPHERTKFLESLRNS